MKILKLIFKNSFRHKLRTSLTIVGIAIAVIAFGILRTVVTAWYAGVDASAADRLVTRNSVSFIFPMPLSYRDKIAQVPGVSIVSYANWFGGTYVDKNQFFPRLAIDPDSYFAAYPEFVISKDELAAFKKERNSCVIGSKLAQQYGFKLGDVIPIQGDIYPGTWEFVVRGIYQPRDKATDATNMFLQWDYLNETMKEQMPGRANNVGWYIEKINNANAAGQVSKKIDELFKNSTAETKTETERAFQQGFIESSGSIITAMNFMSFVIIGIIMLVLGNTMIMSARERTREYAVMKTIGFSAKHLIYLIFGESLFISILGGGIGLGFSFMLINGMSQIMPKGFFPVFNLEPITIILACVSAIVIGIASSIIPLERALNTKIVDGFRFVG